jgi:hypothetical protein
MGLAEHAKLPPPTQLAANGRLRCGGNTETTSFPWADGTEACPRWLEDMRAVTMTATN